MTKTREHIHTHRRFSYLENLVKDFQYALRQLRKEQTFSLAVVLTIALGIGANTAVFAVVDAVIVRPLPYAQPDRFVSIQYLDRRSKTALSNFSYPNFLDFRSQNKVFEHLVSYRSDEFAMVSGQQAFHVDGEAVSWDLFQMLQVRPELGRSFLPGDEKPGTHDVIISDELWRSRFGADPKILDTPVTINGMPFMILGVTPPNFRFPADDSRNQLWTTLSEDAVSAPDDQPLTSQRGALVIKVLGRPKAGVSISQAQSQMDAIAEALSIQYPDNNKNLGRTLIRPELERLTGKSRPAMLILLGAVLLVLLVACANIANLLLSRSAEREREFAVRAALGATGGRLVRQLFAESLVLSSPGCC